MYRKVCFITVRRVLGFMETAVLPNVWRELSTNRFKCHFNELTDVLTTFDDFLTINDDF
jgi:hypothetical protein